jgi:hypothetical protein
MPVIWEIKWITNYLVYYDNYFHILIDTEIIYILVATTSGQYLNQLSRI